jgi:hypothetical protein
MHAAFRSSLWSENGGVFYCLFLQTQSSINDIPIQMKNIISGLIKYSTAALLLSVLLVFSACGHKGGVKEGERLFTLDSAHTDGWLICQGMNITNQYKVYHEGHWKIELPNKRVVDADPQLVDRTLKQLKDFKANKVLEISSASWDSMMLSPAKATKVTLLENGKPGISLYIGKFIFVNNKTDYYVRMEGDDEHVYLVEYYLDYSLKASLEHYRKPVLLSAAPADIRQLVFLDASGERYTMILTGPDFTIDGQTVNRERLVAYMRNLLGLEIKNFADRPQQGAEHIVQISGMGFAPFSLQASRSGDKWTLASTSNAGNYILISQEEMEHIFPQKSFFLATDAPQNKLPG